jgi:hypothetical protein
VQTALLNADHFHQLLLNKTQDCVTLIERLSLECPFVQLFQPRDVIFGDGTQISEFYEKQPFHNYADPEVLLRSNRLTSASNVWLFEWIHFEIVTGDPFFSGHSVMVVSFLLTCSISSVIRQAKSWLN